MKKIGYILPALVLLATSCVRDEILPCPPLQLTITVKDKNYFNVDKVALEERLPEDLPFKAYVPTLHYTLRNASTGETVLTQHLYEVEGDERDIRVEFDSSLPHGKYILTVWGGLTEENPLDHTDHLLELHPDGKEGDDAYLSSDTLLYDATRYAYTSELERAKGKLVIESVDLPQNINYSRKTINKLFENVDSDFEYNEAWAVQTYHQWEPAPTVVSRTWLAPSLAEKASQLKRELYDKEEIDKPALTPPIVPITMERNKITVLRYVYDGSKFTIYVLVNDNWEEVHGMEID